MENEIFEDFKDDELKNKKISTVIVILKVDDLGLTERIPDQNREGDAKVKNPSIHNEKDFIRKEAFIRFILLFYLLEELIEKDVD